MATFLTTRAISSQLEEILINSEKFLYIITPYLQFSPTLYERLSETTRKGNFTSIVCRDKGNLSKIDLKLLMELNCNVYFKKDLHGKCYINESVALISSMNLYNYSEANNRELGVLLTKEGDNVAYGKCLTEIKSIIQNSQSGRLIESVDSQPKAELVEYSWEEFVPGWLAHLSHKFPATVFSLEDRCVSAQKFPIDNVEYSTRYGFATMNLDGDWEKLKVIRSEKKAYFEQILSGYRLYWKSPQMICLYHAKDKQFDRLSDDIDYCTKGLDILLGEIRKLPQMFGH